MSVLRKIGRFFGNAIKKVGSVVGAVTKPLSVAAGAIAPVARLVGPALGPLGMGISKAAEMAPAVLGATQGIANLAKQGGGALVKATS